MIKLSDEYEIHGSMDGLWHLHERWRYCGSYKDNRGIIEDFYCMGCKEPPPKEIFKKYLFIAKSLNKTL